MKHTVARRHKVLGNLTRKEHLFWCLLIHLTPFSHSNPVPFVFSLCVCIDVFISVNKLNKILSYQAVNPVIL